MQRYAIGTLLGSGEFGDVFSATQIDTKAKVALKRLKQRFRSWQEVKLLRDIQAAKSIGRHQNVVSTLEVHWDDTTGSLYMVLEMMNAGSLYDLMVQYTRRNKHIEESLIQSLLRQILLGVAHCHRSKIYHRDLKPENLLLHQQPNGQLVCKLADFSLGRRVPSGCWDQRTGLLLSPGTSYVSTRWYRAPEIWLGDQLYSYPVDVFAVGCIMAEMFELKPLFPGLTEMDQLYRLFHFLGAPHPSTWVDGHVLAVARGLDLSCLSPQGVMHDIFQAVVSVPPGFSSAPNVIASDAPLPPRSFIPSSHDTPPHIIGVHVVCNESNIIPRLSGHGPVSTRAFDLFRGLVALNPAERLAAQQALEHGYFSMNTAAPPNRSASIHQRSPVPRQPSVGVVGVQGGSLIQSSPVPHTVQQSTPAVVHPTPHRFPTRVAANHDDGIDVFFS